MDEPVEGVLVGLGGHVQPSVFGCSGRDWPYTGNDGRGAGARPPGLVDVAVDGRGGCEADGVGLFGGAKKFFAHFLRDRPVSLDGVDLPAFGLQPRS